jgi:Holliday junction DNA helicase RuvB
MIGFIGLVFRIAAKQSHVSSPKRDAKKEKVELADADDAQNEQGESNLHNHRPRYLDEFVGQERIKEIVRAFINGTWEMGRKMPHVLIASQPGLGKTTMAYIIANELGVAMVECVATSLNSPQDVMEKVMSCKGGVLFIDEIHALKPKIAEFMYPILEDFNYEGQRIPRFTLIGCTTEKGRLIRKLEPFCDRFKLHLEMTDYTESELATIIKQYKEKAFPLNFVGEDDYVQIVRNSRGVPRLAIRLLEAFVYLKDIDKTFESYSIISNGITNKDVELMRYLDGKEKGAGLQTISAILGTSEENYLYTIENYLLKKGLIERKSKGRCLTDAGRYFLNQITKGGIQNDTAIKAFTF